MAAPVLGGKGDAEALVTWKAPETWRKAPNPNAMRIATYKSTAKGDEDVEVSVSAAGGGAQGNVDRWIGQFASEGRVVKLEERVIAGLHVRVVNVQGTYLAGTMTGVANDAPKSALLGAVVETGETLTFFKMTGPAAEVEKERGAFDALIKSLTRR
jgi:hypothetical protein